MRQAEPKPQEVEPAGSSLVPIVGSLAEELKRMSSGLATVDVRKILRISTKTQIDTFSIGTSPSSIAISSPEQPTRRRKRWAETAEGRKVLNTHKHNIKLHHHESQSTNVGMTRNWMCGKLWNLEMKTWREVSLTVHCRVCMSKIDSAQPKEFAVGGLRI